MDSGTGAGAGSGNASGGAGGASACCYYALLGIRKNASATDIRAAYRRLALKWHPDRWASDPGAAGEAKRRFQRIQEAYSVLSDKGQRSMYDAGLFDPLDDDDDDDQDFSDFMQEMLVMMDNVKNEKPDTLEDLQKMLEDIVSGDGGSRGGAGACHPTGPGGRASRPTRSSSAAGDRRAGVRDVHARAYAFREGEDEDEDEDEARGALEEKKNFHVGLPLLGHLISN